MGSPRIIPGETVSQAQILQKTMESHAVDARLSTPSVLGHSQLQHRLRLHEGESRLLRQQLETLESKQKQTTDEIVRLSTRNAVLESSATEFQQTKEALEEMHQRQRVLLELFGEKEEQVEELQAEVTELKAFYKKQLDTLTRQQD
jgi:TATA element modulatory factor